LGVETHVIVGTRMPTLVGFDLVSPPKNNLPDKAIRFDGPPTEAWNGDGWFLVKDNRNLVLQPRFGAGDGTVPEEMALLPGATRTYFFKKPNVDHQPRSEQE
jgi:hypothetical protein